MALGETPLRAMPDLSPPVAFLTGGTGFVGSWVAEELLRRGYTVRALVRSAPKWLEGLDVEIVRGDLSDADALRQGVAGADAVVHVAGLTRARDQATLDRANVEGTVRLLDAVRQHGAAVRRVLVTSSLEAMGPNRIGPDGRAIPATEADVPQPVSMYGLSKARMETAVGQYADLPVTIVRPPAVYGPREADIYEMIRGAARGLFPIVGDGAARRLSLVHARDLARGMVDLLEAPDAAGETYFLGSERGYSWEEVRSAVEGALGRRTLRLPVPGALIGVAGALAEGVGGLVGTLPPLTRDKAEAARHAWVCSVEKAGHDVGYRQRVPLAEGMAETVAWYRQHGWL